MTEQGDSQSDASVSVMGERLGLRGLDYEIPTEAQRWTHMLGGLTAFLILLLILTGLYLTQFYNPSPAGAYDSVLYIIARAPFGDWVRSIHYWSAGAAVVTIVAHLGFVFWRRAYRRPREVTWWAGVAMAGFLFLLIVTGTALRYDQEGFEALAHFVSGGRLVGTLGLIFTDDFTRSTSLLSRIFSMHTAVLPLALLGLIGLHFWLIRQLGIASNDERRSLFRRHAVRLGGLALISTAVVGVLAVVAPEGLGYPAVAGVEITKPYWPVLWVYGLENLLGIWGMVLGPLIVFGFLAAVPLFDRSDGRESRGWVNWAGVALGLVVFGLWLYGVFGQAQQHIGM